MEGVEPGERVGLSGKDVGDEHLPLCLSCIGHLIVLSAGELLVRLEEYVQEVGMLRQRRERFERVSDGGYQVLQAVPLGIICTA